MKRILAVMAAAVLLGGATTGTTPLSSTGLKPEIPAVSDSLIPALHFSSNEPWPEGAKPRAPEGFVVTRFATLDTPRWIYVLPNGDVLVSQARTTRKINPFSRSPNRITLLRDSNGDGKPDLTSVFLSGELDRPFGMVLLGGQFYVADTGSVRVYPYKDGQTKLTGKGRKILDLPVGGYNNHWTRNLVARADGKKIYVTVGSASNAGEHGIGEEKNRAAVLEIWSRRSATSATRTSATSSPTARSRAGSGTA